MVCVVVKSLTLWYYMRVMSHTKMLRLHFRSKGKNPQMVSIRSKRWKQSHQVWRPISFAALASWDEKKKKSTTVGSRPFWTIDTVCTGGGWQALKNVRDADSEQWLSYLWEISIMVKEGKKAQENEVCCEPFIFFGGYRAAVVFPSPLMKPPSAWANRPPSSFQRSREWWRGASLYSVRPLMESLTEREELGMESEDSKKKKEKEEKRLG